MEKVCSSLSGGGQWLSRGGPSPAVFPLISRRRFCQIEVLEGLNVLVCINGRKNKLRVYYLSWLRNKILKGDDVRSLHLYLPDLADCCTLSLQFDSHRTRHGFTSVGDLEQSVHYRVGT